MFEPSPSLASLHVEVRQHLALQFSLLGFDARFPGGNLLVRYGFQRTPLTTHVGYSRYSLATDTGTLVLWGWGLAWATRGGYATVLHRDYTSPLVAFRSHIESTWLPGSLPIPLGPMSTKVLSEAVMHVPATLRRLAEYERWRVHLGVDPIGEGVDYPAIESRHELADQWERIACSWEAILAPQRLAAAS